MYPRNVRWHVHRHLQNRLHVKSMIPNISKNPYEIYFSFRIPVRRRYYIRLFVKKKKGERNKKNDLKKATTFTLL